MAIVRSNATHLRRAGTVQILSTQSTTNHSLTGSTGETRIAWKVNGQLPIVQCMRVRRSGNLLTGIGVALLAVSAPIANEARLLSRGRAHARTSGRRPAIKHTTDAGDC